MFYRCCPLALWNVDWSTGTIWSTGTLLTFGGRFTDPELSRLASSLPLRCLGAKADSTTERYSRAFEKFRVWAASHKEINVLPTGFLHVAIYLELLLRSNSSYSALEAAVYGIRWAHSLFGLSNPCDSNLVKGILESAKRSLSRPIRDSWYGFKHMSEICIG